MTIPGAFWGTFAATLVPYYNAYGAYVTDPTTQAATMGNPGNPAGLQVPAFNASFAYFLIFMGESSYDRFQSDNGLTSNVGLICVIFMVCSLRTNVCFFIIFLSLVLAFGLLAGAYMNLALYYENPTNTGAAATAKKLVVVSNSSLPLCLLHELTNTLGRRRMRLRDIHGRMVHLLRYHARVSRLPRRPPRRRPINPHQGCLRTWGAHGRGSVRVIPPMLYDADRISRVAEKSSIWTDDSVFGSLSLLDLIAEHGVIASG